MARWTGARRGSYSLPRAPLGGWGWARQCLPSGGGHTRQTTVGGLEAATVRHWHSAAWEHARPAHGRRWVGGGSTARSMRLRPPPSRFLFFFSFWDALPDAVHVLYVRASCTPDVGGGLPRHPRSGWAGSPPTRAAETPCAGPPHGPVARSRPYRASLSRSHLSSPCALAPLGQGAPPGRHGQPHRCGGCSDAGDGGAIPPTPPRSAATVAPSPRHGPGARRRRPCRRDRRPHGRGRGATNGSGRASASSRRRRRHAAAASPPPRRGERWRHHQRSPPAVAPVFVPLPPPGAAVDVAAPRPGRDCHDGGPARPVDGRRGPRCSSCHPPHRGCRVHGHRSLPPPLCPR